MFNPLLQGVKCVSSTELGGKGKLDWEARTGAVTTPQATESFGNTQYGSSY